jgi:glycosyltransferase involved in cell wall biosynthesis
MRVALVTLEYPPASTGGLGVHVAGLAAALRQQGDHVDVYYVGQRPAPDGVVEISPTASRTTITGAIDIHRVPGVDIVLARHSAEPYDVVHCHDWHGALLAACLWRRGVRMLVTCHLPAGTQFRYETVCAPSLANTLEHLALRLAHRVIAVSQFVAMELSRTYRAFAHKITVVHNGTDPQLFDATDGTCSARILAVGRFTAQKGFDQLPEMFAHVRARVPHATLRLIGAGGGSETLHGEIDRTGIAHVTDVLPFVDQSTLASHYRQARVLAMPSVYEPFGLVAIEAMACGTPVVAYAAGGPAEIITSGVDGVLVPPGDKNGFANALADLVGNPHRAQELGHEARRTVQTRFLADACYRHTRVLYART